MKTSVQTALSGVAGCPPMVTFCLCLLRTYLSVSLLLCTSPHLKQQTSDQTSILYIAKAGVGQEKTTIERLSTCAQHMPDFTVIKHTELCLWKLRADFFFLLEWIIYLQSFSVIHSHHHIILQYSRAHSSFCMSTTSAQAAFNAVGCGFTWLGGS